MPLGRSLLGLCGRRETTRTQCGCGPATDEQLSTIHGHCEILPIKFLLEARKRRLDRSLAKRSVATIGLLGSGDWPGSRHLFAAKKAPCPVGKPILRSSS